MKRRILVRILLPAVASRAPAAGGCALLDEPLEACKEDIRITYRLRLFTDLPEQIRNRLSDRRDEALRRALEAHLSSVFSEYASDVNLSFYDTEEQGERLEHREAVMDAGQATYDIELPARDYHHLALANLASEPHVRLAGDEHRDESCVLQLETGSVPSQAAGLFSARMPISVHRDESAEFDVTLYMVNSAAALVLHRDSCDFVSATCELLGLADGFMVSDSLYTFTADNQVAAPRIPVDTTVTEINWKLTPALFCGVGFPSRDIAVKADDTTWQMALNVLLRDGTVTRNIISVETPLNAGKLIILRGWLHEDGSYEPEPIPDVVLGGISITLDWKEGGHYNPDLGGKA